MKIDFNARKFKYGSAATVYVALFVAIIIVLNIFAQFLTDRFSLKLDMTTTGQFSLSEETKEMLKGIEDEINIYILSTQASMENNLTSKNALEMIQRYNTQSGGKVKYQFVDPNKNPQFFEKYPNAVGSQARALVIEGPQRYKVIESQEFAYYMSTTNGTTDPNKVYYQSEEKLSSAILYVSSPEVSNAGFVVGHNETELPALETIFKGNYFEVSDVNLLEGVPADINNLVISAPMVDYTADEIKALDDYLSIDGNNLYVFWGFETPKLERLERLLEEWGFRFPRYLICDEENSYRTAAEIFPQVVENELISDERQGQLRAVSLRTRPIEMVAPPDGYTQTLAIMQSQDTSYAKIISEDIYNSDLSYKQGDVAGPFVTTAFSARRLGNLGNEGASQVIVFGSQNFVAEDIMGLSIAYNNKFMTQVIDYANPDTLTMAIAPKVVSNYDLNITTSQARTLYIVLIYILPAIILAIGIFVFIRRKNK